jgi:hypothetical protein
MGLKPNRIIAVSSCGNNLADKIESDQLLSLLVSYAIFLLNYLIGTDGP